MRRNKDKHWSQCWKIFSEMHTNIKITRIKPGKCNCFRYTWHWKTYLWAKNTHTHFVLKKLLTLLNQLLPDKQKWKVEEKQIVPDFGIYPNSKKFTKFLQNQRCCLFFSHNFSCNFLELLTFQSNVPFLTKIKTGAVFLRLYDTTLILWLTCPRCIKGSWRELPRLFSRGMRHNQTGGNRWPHYLRRRRYRVCIEQHQQRRKCNL